MPYPAQLFHPVDRQVCGDVPSAEGHLSPRAGGAGLDDQVIGQLPADGGVRDVGKVRGVGRAQVDGLDIPGAGLRRRVSDRHAVVVCGVGREIADVTRTTRRVRRPDPLVARDRRIRAG